MLTLICVWDNLAYGGRLTPVCRSLLRTLCPSGYRNYTFRSETLYPEGDFFWRSRFLTDAHLRYAHTLSTRYDSLAALEIPKLASIRYIFYYIICLFTAETLPMGERWAVWGVVLTTHWCLFVIVSCLRNWDRTLVRAVKGLIYRAGMVSICPLLWQRTLNSYKSKPPKESEVLLTHEPGYILLSWRPSFNIMF